MGNRTTSPARREHSGEATGSYVAYVSDMNYNHGDFNIRLDGKDVFTGTSYSDTVRMQQMLFEATLQPGRHTMSLLNAGGGTGDETATVMGVDYFIYHPLATQLASPSPRSKASEYAIIATFVGVGLALAIITVVFFVMRRRHNRRRAEVSWAPIPETAQPSVETPPPYATERPVQLAQLTKLDRWNRLRK